MDQFRIPKNFFLCRLILLMLLFTTAARASTSDGNPIGYGRQPEISKDSKGVIRIVFGRNDSIFCSTATNRALTFSQPVLVGVVKGMHLGMTRGPQLASSLNASLVTAIDQSGQIHSFLLHHKVGRWVKTGTVNDMPGSAPEGLMSIASDEHDRFYAVWLDIRNDRKNKVYFSSFNLQQNLWSRNLLVYRSPDSTVCECCKPSIEASASRVVIMFRNWLHGSRDLYLVQSNDRGRSFDRARKLGSGTWKLNACPMDGGGIVIDGKGQVHTVWRREDKVYYCRPNGKEEILGTGRACAITGEKGKLVVSLQQGSVLKMIDVLTHKETIMGSGSFLKTLLLDNGKTVCVWEEEKEIKVRVINSK